MKKNKTFMSILIGLAVVSLVGVGLKVFSNNLGDLPSNTSSEAGELMTINLQDHPFRAVNEEVLIVATVSPSNASDKTIVWSSSDANKVSVTSVNATTARIKCLMAFNDQVTITARATNGTSTQDDDFVATCVCTYLEPITSLDLQFVSLTGTPSVTVGQKVNVKVVFAPTVANEAYTFTYNSTYLRNNGSYNDLGYTIEEHWYEFEVIAPTPAGTSTTISVSTVTNSLTDSLTVYCGNHLGINGLILDNGITIEVTEPGQSKVTYASIDNLRTDVVDYNKTFPVDTIIKINLPGYSFVSSDMTISYNDMYLSLEALTGSGLSSPESGELIYSGVGAASMTFKVINANTAVSYVDIVVSAYNVLLGESIPFGLKQPISGINLDTSEYEF